MNRDGFNGDSNGDGDVDGDGGDGYGDHHHHRDNGGSVDRMEAPPLLPPDLEIHPPYENLVLSLLFFYPFYLSLFFYLPFKPIFYPSQNFSSTIYAPFFYFSIVTGPLLSISYILSPHYEPVFCYPSIILPLYKTLFYLSHRFEIFGQWKFPSIFSLRLLFPWEGNDASNFL